MWSGECTSLLGFYNHNFSLLSSAGSDEQSPPIAYAPLERNSSQFSSSANVGRNSASPGSVERRTAAPAADQIGFTSTTLARRFNSSSSSATTTSDTDDQPAVSRQNQTKR